MKNKRMKKTMSKGKAIFYLNSPKRFPTPNKTDVDDWGESDESIDWGTGDESIGEDPSEVILNSLLPIVTGLRASEKACFPISFSTTLGLATRPYLL